MPLAQMQTALLLMGLALLAAVTAGTWLTFKVWALEGRVHKLETQALRKTVDGMIDRGLAFFRSLGKQPGDGQTTCPSGPITERKEAEKQ